MTTFTRYVHLAPRATFVGKRAYGTLYGAAHDGSEAATVIGTVVPAAEWHGPYPVMVITEVVEGHQGDYIGKRLRLGSYVTLVGT